MNRKEEIKGGEGNKNPKADGDRDRKLKTADWSSKRQKGLGGGNIDHKPKGEGSIKKKGDKGIKKIR